MLQQDERSTGDTSTGYQNIAQIVNQSLVSPLGAANGSKKIK